MQNAYRFLAQVTTTPPVIQQLSTERFIQPHRQGIDREISPMEIELNASPLNRGQGCWMGIKLRARRYKIQIRWEVFSYLLSGIEVLNQTFIG